MVPRLSIVICGCLPLSIITVELGANEILNAAKKIRKEVFRNYFMGLLLV
jgi:hypothetical protein